MHSSSLNPTLTLSFAILSIGFACSGFLRGQDQANSEQESASKAIGQKPPAQAKVDTKNANTESSRQTIVVVQGAGGSAEFKKDFSAACSKIKAAAGKSGSEFFWIGSPLSNEASESNKESKIEQGNPANGSANDKQKLKQVLASQLEGNDQLWIILLGHGTYDRRFAKFNLRGPDVSAAELKEWLDPIKRPVAIINCASASSPFINRLSEKGRVVVTATKSGFELNYARFGIHFANALTDLAADIDKDEQVSLLESFLFASRKVEEFYKSESRLATEHALIDDNGDGKGTPLGFFRGFRVVKSSNDDTIPDGPTANQIHLIQSEFEKLLSIENRQRRNALETQIEDLRMRKSELDEETYFAELEKIALQLAMLYKQVEDKQKADKPPPKDNAVKKEKDKHSDPTANSDSKSSKQSDNKSD